MVTTMNRTNTPSISYEDIVTAVESNRGKIYNAARKYDVDGDDLYQELVIHLLEKRNDIINLYAYINFKVSKLACNMRPLHPADSLDVPLSEDSELTLYDVLPDNRTPHTSAYASIVHKAIHRLSWGEQHYLIKKYGIRGLKPWTSRTQKKYTGKRSDHALQYNAMKALRSDKALAAAMEAMR